MGCACVVVAAACVGAMMIVMELSRRFVLQGESLNVSHDAFNILFSDLLSHI